jgi:hypothetical protein
MKLLLPRLPEIAVLCILLVVNNVIFVMYMPQENSASSHDHMPEAGRAADSGQDGDSTKERRLWRIIKATLFGIPVLLIVVYPILVGLVAYVVMNFFSVKGSDDIAIWVAYISLLLLPCYMFGSAMRGGPIDFPKEAAPRCGLSDDELIQVWKTCQDVVIHFDNIELQIHNYAVTLLVAVIGGAAFTVKEHLDIVFRGHRFSMAFAILSAGVVGWLAFYFMDKHWYHRLLIGAVKYTLRVEMAFGPAVDLSGTISREDPVPLWGKNKLYVEHKFDIFYAAGLAILLILIGMVLVVAKAPSENLGHASHLFDF